MSSGLMYHQVADSDQLNFPLGLHLILLIKTINQGKYSKMYILPSILHSVHQ